MAAILKVTPQEVKTKSSQISNEKARMQSLMNEMKSLVNKLPSEFWKSQSGTDYGSRYNSVQTNCNKSLETLAKHAKNLVDASSKYEEIERMQVQKVSQLNTNNIFN